MLLTHATYRESSLQFDKSVLCIFSLHNELATHFKEPAWNVVIYISRFSPNFKIDKIKNVIRDATWQWQIKRLCFHHLSQVNWSNLINWCSHGTYQRFAWRHKDNASCENGQDQLSSHGFHSMDTYNLDGSQWCPAINLTQVFFLVVMCISYKAMFLVPVCLGKLHMVIPVLLKLGLKNDRWPFETVNAFVRCGQFCLTLDSGKKFSVGTHTCTSPRCSRDSVKTEHSLS